LNKRRARITNGRGLVASEIMRRGFHIANGILQLANGDSDTGILCANLEVARNRQVETDQRPHPHQNEERSNRNRCHRRSLIKPPA